MPPKKKQETKAKAKAKGIKPKAKAKSEPKTQAKAKAVATDPELSMEEVFGEGQTSPVAPHIVKALVGFH